MVKKKPTIALFGGSFDPPHKGHQAIIKKTASLLDIDTLVIMPAFLNPFKKSTLASPKKRLEWCKEVCDIPKVTVSDFEILQGRPVYTIQTLDFLKKEYEVKYLVIGSDNLDSIDRWKDFDKINDNITWLVFTRDNKADYSKLREYKTIELDMPISSTDIRDGNSLEHIDKRIQKDVANIIKQKETDDNQRES